ncbi:MAG: hypothetical protein ACTSUE_19295 [Promethearchaeota archaeon]
MSEEPPLSKEELKRRDIHSNLYTSKNPNITFIMGNPQGEGKDDAYTGFALRSSEFDVMAKQMIGKPLTVEHEGPQIGTWQHVWHNRDTNKLEGIASLDTGTIAGGLASVGISKGLYKGFSMGNKTRSGVIDLKGGGKKEVVGMFASDHISLVKEPAIPGSDLFLDKIKDPVVKKSKQVYTEKTFLDSHNNNTKSVLVQASATKNSTNMSDPNATDTPPKQSTTPVDTSTSTSSSSSSATPTSTTQSTSSNADLNQQQQQQTQEKINQPRNSHGQFSSHQLEEMKKKLSQMEAENAELNKFHDRFKDLNPEQIAARQKQLDEADAKALAEKTKAFQDGIGQFVKEMIMMGAQEDHDNGKLDTQKLENDTQAMLKSGMDNDALQYMMRNVQEMQASAEQHAASFKKLEAEMEERNAEFERQRQEMDKKYAELEQHARPVSSTENYFGSGGNTMVQDFDRRTHHSRDPYAKPAVFNNDHYDPSNVGNVHFSQEQMNRYDEYGNKRQRLSSVNTAESVSSAPTSGSSITEMLMHNKFVNRMGNSQTALASSRNVDNRSYNPNANQLQQSLQHKQIQHQQETQRIENKHPSQLTLAQRAALLREQSMYRPEIHNQYLNEIPKGKRTPGYGGVWNLLHDPKRPNGAQADPAMFEMMREGEDDLFMGKALSTKGRETLKSMQSQHVSDAIVNDWGETANRGMTQTGTSQYDYARGVAV